MKKSLTINATRDGKKVAKSFGFVNPNVANSLVGGFAQMVNNLTTDTFVNAQVVKVMDTTEEDTSSQSQTPAAKQEGIITLSEYDAQPDGKITFTYNGDGTLEAFNCTINGNTIKAGSALQLNGTGIVFAEATANYTAAVATIYIHDGAL